MLGHYLFTELLQPLLSQTAQARDSAEGSVRVIWVSSVVHDKAPPHGGINYDDINYARPGSTSGSKQWEPYGQSKAAAIILAREFARRYGDTGVLSLSLNPGNLKTSLQRHNQSLGMRLIVSSPLPTSIPSSYASMYIAGADILVYGLYMVTDIRIVRDSAV